MENTEQKKDDDAIQRPNPFGRHEYFTQQQFNTKYQKLKRFVVGTQLLTDDEKNLFMNADEYFNIDKVEVTFPLTKGRQVMVEIPKPDGCKDGEPYTNTVLDPYYDSEELEAALANKELGPFSEWSLETARFCLHAYYIEKCFCAYTDKRDADEVLAFILHRMITSTYRTPTLGQREAVTRAYQDLIRVRKSEDGKSKIRHCMYRIGSHRFPRSLKFINLKPFNNAWGEENESAHGLVQRMTRRVLFIHACITKFTGKSQKAVLPEELKFPEGATLEIKPTESPTSHEQPTDM